MAPSAIRLAAFTKSDANRVHRCRQSCRLYHFEAFTADEKSAGMFETQHQAATALRELAALPCPDGDAP
jgi:hypothetical protein